MKKLLLIILFLPAFAHATCKHHCFNNPPPQVTNVTNINNLVDGTALALAAAQHQYTWSDKFQAGAAYGNFNGRDALSIAAGAMLNKSLLLNGSIGCLMDNIVNDLDKCFDDDKEAELGGGIGFMLKF